MKSKKFRYPLIALSFAIFLFLFYRQSQGPLGGILEKEILEQNFPTNVDAEDSIWHVLPYGYTLGPWPTHFRNEPIVTKLSYVKGPPQKFIQSMTQLWQPVEVELSLLGPLTLSTTANQSEWKDCFDSRWTCSSKRQRILDYVAHPKDEAKLSKVTWFEHPDSQGPRGVHLVWDYPRYQIDDFVVITVKGVAQGFELKSVKSSAGEDARALLYRILGTLKVSDDLASSREWIQHKIRSVQLAKIQAIPDQKLRLRKLIETQSWLFSLLSVNPTEVSPFFHLAGVTHLLVLDLLKLQTNFFENQESWILSAKPNLTALFKYASDFEEGVPPEKSVAKQIDILIQDVLLQQQKVTTTVKK